MRSFDAKQEDEANWLGWTLLLPRPALMHCVHLGLSTAQIAVDYDVSEQLVRYRAGITGVHGANLESEDRPVHANLTNAD